jgi:hypothetical protein
MASITVFFTVLGTRPTAKQVVQVKAILRIATIRDNRTGLSATGGLLSWQAKHNS